MEDIFEVPKKCLRILGHTFNENLEYTDQRILYAVSLFLVITAQFPALNYLMYYIDDLTIATASLTIYFTNVLTVAKLTTFIFYKPKYVIIMQQITDMYMAPKSLDAQLTLRNAKIIASKFASIYFYSVCITGVYFMVGPIIKLIYALLHNRVVVRELPMPMRFPFDFETSPGYEFCYMYTGIVTVIVIMYSSGVDGLFITFAINLRAHFQLLQQYLKCITFLHTKEEIHQQLSSIIQYHMKVLDITELIREVFAPIIFTQFLMTSVQVCVIIYQLVTHMDKLSVFLVYCAFLCSIMLQLAIYCYGGEIIRQESFKVGTAVNFSNWYNLPTEYQRMLCLLILRSQRVAVIKAGFYEATLANFMMILKAAISYMTLIQSIE